MSGACMVLVFFSADTCKDAAVVERGMELGCWRQRFASPVAATKHGWIIERKLSRHRRYPDAPQMERDRDDCAVGERAPRHRQRS